MLVAVDRSWEQIELRFPK